MATLDLSAFDANDVVLHFGGRPNDVNAETFANTLLALSEALRALNAHVNPGTPIEIAIDAIGPGSFRTRIKAIRSRLPNLLSGLTKNVVIPLLLAIIYDKIIKGEEKIHIEVDDSRVVIQRGSDRIIMPKSLYDQSRAIPYIPEVDKNIVRAFDNLQEDQPVKEFGFTPGMKDERPVALIPRQDFGAISRPYVPHEPSPRQRVVEQRARLVILRAIFQRGERKWQFVWAGIRISAPITDDAFFDALARREYEFGQGDTLDVTLRVYQLRDDDSGAYINDSYEVVKVHGRGAGPKQESLLPNLDPPDEPGP